MTLVSLPGDGRTLRAHLHRPPGAGPFPAVVWNHGSERAPGAQERLGAFYTAAGYTLLVPHRRGYGRSPGEHFATALADRARTEPRERIVASLIEVCELQLADTLAAARWLAEQPFVERDQMAMSGVSHGAIQTLLAAESDAGMRAYVPFAPAAIAWEGNPELHARLLRAVRQAGAPVFLVQAANDHSLGPSDVLGAELRRKGGRNRAAVYPPYGRTPDDGHGAFACRGMAVWGEDVRAFLAAALADRSAAPAA